MVGLLFPFRPPTLTAQELTVTTLMSTKPSFFLTVLKLKLKRRPNTNVMGTLTFDTSFIAHLIPSDFKQSGKKNAMLRTKESAVAETIVDL